MLKIITISITLVVIHQLLTAALVLCQIDNPLNSSLILGGYNKCRDDQVFLMPVEKPSSLLRVVVEDVTYPPEGVTPLYNITCIRVLDQCGDGTGGSAIVKEGGLGFNNVTLHLKSQRGNGFNFLVEIWGRKYR